MKVNPYLNFNGRCEEAFKLYERCLGARMGEIFRYGSSPMAGEMPADWQNNVMHGSVTIGDQVLMGADVATANYEVPKGISLSIHVSEAAEAERIFRELSQNGRVVMALEKTFWAERFGMLVDPYGIPWMINCGG